MQRPRRFTLLALGLLAASCGHESEPAKLPLKQQVLPARPLPARPLVRARQPVRPIVRPPPPAADPVAVRRANTAVEPCSVGTAWIPYFTDGTPEFQARQNFEAALAARRATEITARPSYRGNHLTVPVVVHVVLKEADPSLVVTREMIDSQIDALNRDFAAVVDAQRIEEECKRTLTVCAASAVAAAPAIRFALAARDSTCGSTDGIIYRSSVTAAWDLRSDGQTLFASLNAESPAWNTERYLNVWVVETSTDVVGVSSIPAVPPEQEGIAVSRKAFGDTSSPSWPAGKFLSSDTEFGCTLTHEIGHWLGLYHLWGEGALGDCLASDKVADTPQQSQSWKACGQTSDSCGDPGKDICFDFMDYTADSQRMLFTAGQQVRMQDTFRTSRKLMLGTHGHIPPDSSGPDTWLSDSWDDIGDEPSSEAVEPPWVSVDLWVRSEKDGEKFSNHQSPADGTPLHVFARVRNRGCTASVDSTLQIAWARPGAELSWPWPWNAAGPDPPLGDLLTPIDVPPIAPGDSVLLTGPIVMPPPMRVLTEHSGQVSLLGFLADSGSPAAGPATSAGHERNDVVLKSVWVVDPWKDPSPSATVWFTNPTTSPRDVWLRLAGGWRDDLSPYTDVATITLVPDATLLACLAVTHVETGLTPNGPGPTAFGVALPDAELGPFTLPPGAACTLRLDVQRLTPTPSRVGSFVLDVQQNSASGGGGQRLAGGVLGITLDLEVKPPS